MGPDQDLLLEILQNLKLVQELLHNLFALVAGGIALTLALALYTRRAK